MKRLDDRGAPHHSTFVFTREGPRWRWHREIGISQAQVSRLEKNALKCMRSYLTGRENHMRMNRKGHGSSASFFGTFPPSTSTRMISASDLDDTPPWDHVLKIPSEKPAQPAGTRDDQGKHAAGAAVDLQVR